jgi:predicted small lipoprotein YifL
VTHRLANLFLAVVLVLALALPLTACGKRGPLQPPPGEESHYPQKYPRQ